MTRPSFADYGTYDESAHRDLWDGVVGYWAPCLGATGTRLHDVSRYGNWGTLTNMDAATDWVIDGGQYALDFDGSDDFVLMNSERTYITDAQPFTILTWVNVRSLTNLYSKIILLPSDDAGGNSFEFGVSSDTSYQGLLAGTATSYARIRSATTTADITSAGMAVYGISYNGQGRGTAGNYTFLFKNNTITPVSAAAFSSVGRIAQLSRNANLNRLDGKIAEAIIWHRQLTQNDFAVFRGLGPGGMLERRRRRRVYSVQDTANRRRRIICGAEC